MSNGMITLEIKVGTQEEMDVLMELINTAEEEGEIETISVREVDRDLNTPRTIKMRRERGL